MTWLLVYLIGCVGASLWISWDDDGMDSVESIALSTLWPIAVLLLLVVAGAAVFWSPALLVRWVFRKL